MKRTLVAVLAMVMVLDLGVGQAHVYAQENIPTEAAETVTQEMKKAETESGKEMETTVEETEAAGETKETEATEETETAVEETEAAGETEETEAAEETEETEAAEETETTVEETEETEAAEETEETEEADEGLETVGELAPLPDDPEYIKLQQEAQTADGLSVEGHLRGANWDGYTHNAKFNGRTVRNGIDVSYYQGSIDWNAVKNSGIDFVFVRVGYRGYSNGALKEDPNAAANINGALTAGLKVGVYMFSQAVNADEAAEEARFALSKISGYNITMPVVMDFEFISGGRGRLYQAGLSKDAATTVVNGFAYTVSCSGYTPMIYANKTMLENYMNASGINAKIWLANYTSQTSYAGDYDYWQYRSNGYVSGIQGNVDCDFWYDDTDGFTQTVPDGIYTINSALNTGYALDVTDSSRSNRANIRLYEKTKRSAQDFKIIYRSGGEYAIVAMCSGKSIDAEGGTSAGANLIQYDWLNGSNQHWYIQDAGNGYYYIRSVADKNLCLEVEGGNAYNGANIYINQFQAKDSQKFRFSNTEYARTIENGVYKIEAESNTNAVFDVSGASEENGGNIGLWENLGGSNQKFSVKHIGGGIYTISPRNSGKYLDAENGGTTNGTNVIQYENNGALNQRWYIKDAGDGSYNIVSNSGLYITADGSVESGTNLKLYEGNGATQQRFQFVKAEEHSFDEAAQTGWKVENGQYYWYDNGVMARDKEVYDPDSDEWHWFDADGTMARDKDVFIPTNAERTEGKWVRYDANGYMVKGEDYRYGGWYWLDLTTGEMYKGFTNIQEQGNPDGKWVYYDTITGQMHHGESCIDGNWYYFDDYTGKMVHGEYQRNGNWYYYDSVTGIMAHGWTTLPNGNRYYYDEVTGIRR